MSPEPQDIADTRHMNARRRHEDRCARGWDLRLGRCDSGVNWSELGAAAPDNGRPACSDIPRMELLSQG